MISKGTIRPDPDRLHPLQELPAPHNLASQKRIVGMLAHYSKCIPKFSEKVRPLTQNKIFRMPSNVLHAFQIIKKDIENSVVSSIDETIPF